MAIEETTYRPKHPVRVVTATALFDGHDASINIIRRILQDSGAEVIHLGHNRSVAEIVKAAIEEDVQGVAVSSYQGGHMEFFTYLRRLLNERGGSHIRIFGGGGGVIVPDEIEALESSGITKIYSPEDGERMGLSGMISHMLEHMDFSTTQVSLPDPAGLSTRRPDITGRLISYAEQKTTGAQNGTTDNLLDRIREKSREREIPVIGITGTGGAGKSSLTDEIILRFRYDAPDLAIGIICCDPSRKKTGGALLGDRIRMNAIDAENLFVRSMAVRRDSLELPAALPDALSVLKAAGYDLVIVETAGIGQGASNILDLSDISIYVMTPEFGAASQLEKIDMLDFADLVAVNKFDREGSEDALREIAKQVQRNRKAFDTPPGDMPVFGTIASRFNDDGVTALYHGLCDLLHKKCGLRIESMLARKDIRHSTDKTIIIPPRRKRYLAEVAETIRSYHEETKKQAENLRAAWHVKEAASAICGKEIDKIPVPEAMEMFEKAKREAESLVTPETRSLMEQWEAIRENYSNDSYTYQVRDKKVTVKLFTESLSGTMIPKVALPDFKDPGAIYTWMRKENIPGRFPFTAGVFPFKRTDEDPTRMFAGEGDPARTNRRFRLLSAESRAKRLSTAFDSVTLYGCDPDRRPDIYGKVGTSGVSVCSLDDMKILYSGFDLASPDTSVSMTINGPAPMILAMFLNTAIDQQVEKFSREKSRMPDPGEARKIRAHVLQNIRGTVQADILKEDQGQNTCIFSIDFALKMMADIQEFFIEHNMKNFYSISVSGYHIAEAGANPVTQLSFTLANGFTYVEYYLARGMHIDDFAPNLSFFFSSGMDPEYSVIGRVARRIWAIAMKERYRASDRSQMLKYHIQTSGRSLHAQEIQFNDIRTTLQALYAIYDNCNSLHTNAYDEAVTTPTEESVRRSLAIQLIINRELGLAKNENPLQGSFIIRTLTDLVEEAVIAEFDRIAERGGVFAAMERGYQRSRIQEESLYYEYLKHTGKLPIIGVNTFKNPAKNSMQEIRGLELARATKEEIESQIRRRDEFMARNKDKSQAALERLKQTAISGGNIFAELMGTVRYCTLGQITNALYEVGGRYRRNM